LPSYNELLTQLLALLRRSIPTQALTALLATLSALFKYLLIPSTNNTDAAQVADQNVGHDEDDDLLKATWKQILRSLPRCNAEVQRAVGEVWGVGVLRRVKGKERERTVGFLIEGEGESMQGKGVQDFCAWCVVSACKVRTLYFHFFESFGDLCV
jgi:U3 small nucleolar RNA-associated protein 20